MVVDPVMEVFAYWQEAHDKKRAFLDKEREKVIKDALKIATVQDLKEAIEGYKYSEFHQGKNDRQKKYLDISLMLRDAKHIEAGLEYLDQHREKQKQRRRLEVLAVRREEPQDVEVDIDAKLEAIGEAKKILRRGA